MNNSTRRFPSPLLSCLEPGDQKYPASPLSLLPVQYDCCTRGSVNARRRNQEKGKMQGWEVERGECLANERISLLESEVARVARWKLERMVGCNRGNDSGIEGREQIEVAGWKVQSWRSRHGDSIELDLGLDFDLTCHSVGVMKGEGEKGRRRCTKECK
ncbi:hypothetical protein K437DRAFT_108750 [Tilletiaria anomala UBC 951]|uniref:Uncharacterized protein n=1 Tax=Tilletiaria anomala (strain ATCC 24038 / CBS 436.72 / UBC 951) TaxID=1037660 RepID=A0A066VX21_TILAU|nr:uncharacterized protein K437DRAFT_108750 [Tilletiaria anomala UBC 951]KDN46277.1 hypothetical protein K437DRAFT_108750 [Tilletiaria anomala UBC 951]